MRARRFPGTRERLLSPAPAELLCSLVQPPPGGHPRCFHHDHRILEGAPVGPRGRPDLAGVLVPPAAGSSGQAAGSGRPAPRGPEPTGIENGAGRVPTRGAESPQAAPAGGAG